MLELRVKTENVCFGDFLEFRQSSAKLLVWPFKCTGGKMLFKVSFCLVFIWTSAFTFVAKCILIQSLSTLCFLFGLA